jgi:hypothetical protein
MPRKSADTMLAKEVRALRKMVEKLMQELGATPGDLGYSYRINTKAGPLDLGVSEMFSAIMTRFEDEKLARVFVSDSNPYSGKWNFHFSRVTAAQAFEHFRSRLAEVVPALNKETGHSVTMLSPGQDV